MKIKRFAAQDMTSALVMVREELGEDAVIISTRTLGTGPGVAGKRGMRGVEVVAGVDDRPGASVVQQALSVAAVSAGGGTPAVAPAAARAAYTREMAASGTRPATPRPAQPPSVTAPSFPRVSRDGGEVEDELEQLLPFSEALAAARARAAGGTPTPHASVERGAAAGAPVARPPVTPVSAEADEQVPVSLRRAPAQTPTLLQGAETKGWEVPSYVPPPLPRTTVSVPMAAAGQQVPPPLPDTPRPASQAANPALEAAEHAFALLLDAGLSDTTASTVLEEAIRLVPPTALTHPERLIETGLARLVALLPGGPSLTAETLAGKTVFFTGPAGSGKTTALLKTALHLRRAGADIGIAGADVSRIGAAEQLLRYGEVLRLPVAIAYEPDDLARTLAEAPPGRITLVDTAAAGPGPDGLDELQAYLAAADDPIVVLTVSAGTGEGDLRRLSAMARAIGVATTAITRLDTAAPAASGVALNILAHLRLPLLLCSAGRDVLAGLSRVTAAALAAQTVEALLSADDDTETARAAA